MRFAVDATPILSGGKGLAIFLETFLDFLARSEALKPVVVYVDVSFFEKARSRWPGIPLTPVRSRPALLWERLRLPRLAKRDGIEILFTGRDRTACEPACETVVYLFEVPDYRTGASLMSADDGWYSKAAALLTRYAFASVARRVTRLIVSSEFTRRELEERYGVPKEKIAVVYPGLRPGLFSAKDSELHREARRRFTAGRSYVLHFATGDPRDNTETALAAFARAAPRLRDEVALLLAGVSEQRHAAIEQLVARYGITGRCYMAGFLTGESLSSAYLEAEAYLDPTLYEGFGFQLLEAMASGVPVLSSRVSSVPEVVQDAGFLCDPRDVEEFASGLVSILNDPGRRESMILKGVERARQFSWDETTSQLASVITAITPRIRETSGRRR